LKVKIFPKSKQTFYLLNAKYKNRHQRMYEKKTFMLNRKQDETIFVSQSWPEFF